MTDNSIKWTICGATAGLAVDLGLYPLDTIKTRLQSKDGFKAAGGFRNVYSGMSSVAIGSAPGAALFFLTYGSVKRIFGHDNFIVHGIAASIGEIAACLIRVPTELIKQRSQATRNSSLSSISKEIYRSHSFSGFYRGYLSTVVREIPFALLQYPLWEFFKKKVAKRSGHNTCTPLEGAACGSLAGAISAGLTTPLDVAKTRIMLSRSAKTPTITGTIKQVYMEGGVSSLYAGVTPRVMWLTVGGFVYFGAYEGMMSLTNWIAPN